MTTPHPTPLPADSEFFRIYPDIDPSRPLPAQPMERIGMAAGVAVLAGGVALGNVIVMAVGVVLSVVAAWAAAQSPLRRVRAEARARFPRAGWAESGAVDTFAKVATVVMWLLVVAVPLVVLFVVPVEFSRWSALAAAVVAAVLVWFMPGLCPWWSRRAQRRRAASPAQADAVFQPQVAEDDTQVFAAQPEGFASDEATVRHRLHES